MSPSEIPGYAYDETRPAEVDAAADLVTENPEIPDVRRSFRRIAAHGEFLSAWDGGMIEGIRYTRVNLGRLNRAKNHFQGIQRLRTGRHLALSGGDVNEKASHVFIVRMASRRSRPTWGSNVRFSSEPPDDDRIVTVVALDDRLWHSGGISVLGDVLAVPIESAELERSRIVFLHLEDPEAPRRFPFSIERPNRKATAAALTRTGTGKYVCAVLWGEQSIHFYRSNSDDFHDGFEEGFAAWSWDDLKDPPDGDRPGYQTLNFVHEAGEDGGPGACYLVGLENGSPAAPHVPGRDLAGLLSVEGLDAFADASEPGPPELTWVDEREFFCRDEHCNMAAAAGVHLDPSGEMSVYAGYHWRVDDMIRLTEFRCRDRPDRITEMTDAWVELFEGKDFTGRCLALVGADDAEIEDYGKILVQGGRFNDTVSSVRYQIPEGHAYRLHVDPGFSGEEAGEDFLDLVGDGTEGEIPDLEAEGFGDRVSSSRYVPVDR